jgi:hypothetical protein
MHDWQFFRAGGFTQISLERGSDLANLRALDQKLWTALACPVDGIRFERQTLELIDTDGDGRIRAPELLAAIDWALARLRDPEELIGADDTLPLAALDETRAEGEAIGTAARRVLQELGRTGDGVITLADALGAAELLATRPLNGDGIVPPDSTADTSLGELIDAIVAAGLGVADRNGTAGAGTGGLAAFLQAAAATRAWRAEVAAGPALQPLGEGTAAAAAAVDEVAAKVEDFFARCALVRFDVRAEQALNCEEEAWLALAARDLGIEREEVRVFPLARVMAHGRLPLQQGVNPAWFEAIRRLHDAAVAPLLGPRAELEESAWQELRARLAPFQAWQARRPANALDAVDDQALAALCAPGRVAALEALIAADREIEPAFNALTDLLKLIRLRRDLAPFCRNFVNFSDFYLTSNAASFQCGTLYLDQRSCALCIKVGDPARHAALAGMAGAYLAYCDCVRPGSGEKIQIVAAVTDGDSENLLVGRNGVFYDREGRDWDATITRIVDNPISVRQAFWSPYKKVALFMQEQVARRAASADSAAGQKLEGAVSTLPPPPAPAAPRKIDVGTVAALGVALGSLGTAFGYFLKTVAEIKAWQFPLLLAGLVLLVSGPSMILAWLKLRRRNLAPLLDASGWAVNARALVNVPFGASLTATATLPAGARASGEDRFASRGRLLPRLLFAGFVAWWLLAFAVDMGWLPEVLER